MAKQRNPRVLVLNHFAAPLGHAGGTRHIELFSRLPGWDHLILAGDRNYLTGSTVESSPGFSAVHVTSYTANGPSRIANWISYAVAASITGLRVGKLDVVYASSPHLLAALAGWALSVIKRAHFVLEVRDLWPRVLLDMGQLRETSITYRALSALEGFLYERASRIVVMAEGSRTELIGRGVSLEKIHFIPNGADPEDFLPSAPRKILRERYDFTRFTAIYAGAHGPANGLDLLLDAAEKVRGGTIDIVLVGGGVAKEALQTAATNRRLANVRFLDPVPKTEIPDLLSAADLGLHVLADVELFRSAVSPNKVFDYMASGTPVLTNCPGVVGDLIEDARCGEVVEPGDLDEGLRNALASDEAGQGDVRGSNGAIWMGENQSRTAMAARVKHLLDALLTTEGTK